MAVELRVVQIQCVGSRSAEEPKEREEPAAVAMPAG
jgi:hypothetical protein